MLKTLLGEIREYKKVTLMTPLFTALEVVMEVLIPYVTAWIIDRGINAGDMKAVLMYGGLMVIMAFCSLYFGTQAGKNAAEAATGFAKNVRDDMYKKIQTYSFSNIDKYSTAGLVTRMTTDVTNLQNAFQMIIRIAVRPPLMLIISVMIRTEDGGPVIFTQPRLTANGKTFIIRKFRLLFKFPAGWFYERLILTYRILFFPDIFLSAFL